MKAGEPMQAPDFILHPDVVAIFRIGAQINGNAMHIGHVQAAMFDSIAVWLDKLPRDVLIETITENYYSMTPVTVLFGELLPNFPTAVIRRLALCMLIGYSKNRPAHIQFSPFYQALIAGDNARQPLTTK